MISFERFTLNNGLKVLVHQDKSTPLAIMNILYNVGARDEDPTRTGFAHLFEHLMFGGSINIPRFDEPLERVGGENNAFTNCDITNYYLTLPAANIETAFWLESDRMLNLAFSEQSLEVQRKVVCEEFKQRYLNQPYGDAWLHLRPLAYKVHPYRWNTIGMELSHIENASMDDVRSFYAKHYNPANAIMVIAGNVDVDQIKKLCIKWFEPIVKPHVYKRNLPKEPVQTEERFLSLKRKVPFDAIYMAFHMCNRCHADYQAHDLISDVLSHGNSSRLYQKLVIKNQLFSDIAAYISGDIDEGLFIIQGELLNGISLQHAQDAIRFELDLLIRDGLTENELQRVKNKAESAYEYSRVNVLDRATNLAYYELLGDANGLNAELDKYMSVSQQDILRVAANVFRPQNVSIMHYIAD